MSENTKRKILALYTGGTIGMEKDDYDHSLRPGSLENLKKNIPQIGALPYQIDFQEFFGNNKKLIDSSDANINYFNSLAKKIGENITEYDSVVVIYGTDTMGPSAGYLSYMLEGLSKPVIFTGAMKPANEVDSDGPRNLLDALDLAGRSGVDIPALSEVVVCFAGKIIRGAQAFKYSAQEFDAFRSQGYPLLGTIDGESIKINEKELLPELHTSREFKVNTIPSELFPGDLILSGMSEELLSKVIKYVNTSPAVFFSGRAIAHGSEVEKIILENIPKDKPIFYFDQSDAPSERFIKIEGIFDYQQAIAKVHYLLSRTKDQKILHELCSGNLRGENDKTLINETKFIRNESSREQSNHFKLK